MGSRRDQGIIAFRAAGDSRHGRAVGLAALIATMAAAGSAGFASAGPAEGSTPINVPCQGLQGGPAGLVAAINTANGSGGGAINLAPGCRYTFTGAVGGTEDALPPVTSSIVVRGQGSRVVRSQAQGTPAFRILEIAGGGNLTLDNLIISGGSAQADESSGGNEGNGGGILNNGIATLSGVQVTDNSASFVGGGIADLSESSALTMTRSVVTHNQLSNQAQLTPSVGGAGIEADGTVVLSNSSVTANVATTVDGVARGGGILLETSANFRLSNTAVSGNTTNGDPSVGSAQGGGIFNAGGQLDLSQSQLIGNSATAYTAEGGGMVNAGTATFVSSPVVGNRTTGLVGAVGNGGGIENKGTLSLTKSPLTGNTASAPSQGTQGGGLANTGTATLVASPVTGNRALPAGSSEGGGIFNGAGTVTLNLSPVVANVPNNCSPPGSVAGCTG
jgi:hypothetical protein